MLQAYTDGSSLWNPWPWWWAFLVIDHGGKVRREKSGAEPDTTNNRMELTAVVELLRYMETLLQAVEKGKVEGVIVWSDSTYVSKWITEYLPRRRKNGRKTAQKKPVANQDLWQKVDTYLPLVEERVGSGVTRQRVKAHDTNTYNNRVDYLARKAAETIYIA